MLNLKFLQACIIGLCVVTVSAGTTYGAVSCDNSGAADDIHENKAASEIRLRVNGEGVEAAAAPFIEIAVL